MKAERVILSFIALLIGLGVAGGVFYLYQSTKNVEEPGKKPLPTIAVASPTPGENSGHTLVINSPKDEDVTDDDTITISGKTDQDAIVVIGTDSDEQVASPTATGAFTVTLSLEDGENLIHVLAKFSDGTEKMESRTVTVSSENF